MFLLDALVACPACNCHARPAERACPHCGAPLRRDDGSTPRTAGAMLLGLLVATAAPALAGCGSTVETRGGGTTTSETGAGGASTTGAGGAGGAGGSTTTTSEGCGGFPISADYGVPPTTTTCPPGGGGSGP